MIFGPPQYPDPLGPNINEIFGLLLKYMDPYTITAPPSIHPLDCLLICL